MGRGTTILKLTIDELLALAGLYEAPGYPGVEVDDATPERLDELAGSGARSLIARGLLEVQTGPEDALVPAPQLGPAIAPLIPPIAAALVTVFREGTTTSEIWWIETEAVTRQESDELGVVTFSTMSAEQGHDVLAEVLDADDRSAPEGGSFDAEWSDLVDAFGVFAVWAEGTEEGDPGVGTHIRFTPAGERLLELQSAARHINRVDLFWQPDAERREVATVIWVDCGDRGCWHVEPTVVSDAGEPQTYRIEPISPRGAYDLVVSGIPELASDDLG